MFDWIAFDADDTLWKNEEEYLHGRQVFLQILADYDINQDALDKVDEFEVENIQYYGYGVMSFALSMIEMAIELTGERIHPGDIRKLLNLAKAMLTAEVEVFDGVRQLLKEISKEYPLMLITKGDLFHQQRKLEASGLAEFFQAVEVVSDKTPEIYREILKRHQISPHRFIMVGNSLRSDVIPVLNLGAWAIYLSDHLTWSHEDDPLAEISQDRYREVKEISQVLSAVEALEN
ncbi:MAG: HAD hydrolase-like protein [Anaerolineales bacterium]|nr:HAD hydrolase-like protein [Anaerolineales bacterium]